MSPTPVRAALTAFVVALFILFFSAPALETATAYSDMPPARRTGAPGEGTCNSCHNGELNDGQGALAITGVPGTYVPGQTYTLSVTLSRASQTRWGFELTALDVSANMGGTFVNTTALTGTQISSGKTYVSHTTLNTPNDGTFAGTADGPVTWSFDWVAPVAGTGQVTFYAAGVAADNDQEADGGDLVYTTTATSQESLNTSVTYTTWGKIKALYR